MAGSFVTIVNPGYSTLFTRDLGYAPSALMDGGTSVNVFDPDASHPLQEGEWLSMGNASGSAGKFVRGIPATPSGGLISEMSTVTQLTVIDTTSNDNPLMDRPCFMYFQERGRYDAQVTRKAHCIVGPAGFEFRTKMAVCTNNANRVGDRVFVQACQDSSNRLVMALVAEQDIGDSYGAPSGGEWYAGVISQVHGTNDITVQFAPGFA